MEIQLQSSKVVVVEQLLMKTSPHITPAMCLNHGLERTTAMSTLAFCLEPFPLVEFHSSEEEHAEQLQVSPGKGTSRF